MSYLPVVLRHPPIRTAPAPAVDGDTLLPVQAITSSDPVPIDLAAASLEGAFFSARDTLGLWWDATGYSPARTLQTVQRWQPAEVNGFTDLRSGSFGRDFYPETIGDLQDPLKYLRFQNDALVTPQNLMDNGEVYLSICFHSRDVADGIVVRMSAQDEQTNRFYLWNDGYQVANDAKVTLAELQDDTLHHVAMQRRSDHTFDMWVDGVLVVNNASISPTMGLNSGPLVIGGFGANNASMNGGIHSLAFIRGVPSAQQRDDIDQWVRDEAGWSASDPMVPALDPPAEVIPGVAIADGMWLFLQEPQMEIAANGNLLAGTVDGSIGRVHVFDEFGAPVASHVAGFTNLQDDHNNGTVLRLLDDSILSIQNAHNLAPVYVMRSTDNGLTFSTPVNIQPQLNSTENSYPYIVQVPNGTIYLFHRGRDGGVGSRDFLWSKSTDNGVTWTASAPLLLNSGASSSWSPYVSIIADGARIHFICSRGHPDAESPNQLFYFYWENEAAFDAAGNSISLPDQPQDVLTPVDDGSAGEPFPMDIIIHEGEVYALWHRNVGLKDGDEDSVDPPPNDRVDFVRGHLSGGSWTVEIVSTNTGLQQYPISFQALYSGWGVFAPDNPDEVWGGIRRNLTDWHQIARLTRQGGPEWTITEALTRARADCIRPFRVGSWIGYVVTPEYSSINSYTSTVYILDRDPPVFAGDPLTLRFTDINAADSSETGTVTYSTAVPIVADQHHLLVVLVGITVVGINGVRLNGQLMDEQLFARQPGTGFQGTLGLYTERVVSPGGQDVTIDYANTADMGVALYTISNTGEPLEVADSDSVVSTVQAVRSVTVTAPADDGREIYVIVTTGTVNASSDAPNAALAALNTDASGDASGDVRSDELVFFRSGPITAGATVTFEATCATIAAYVVR